MRNEMLVYDTTDTYGRESRHLAINKDSAIMAHLIHFKALPSLNKKNCQEEKPTVSEGRPLWEFERGTICWCPFCCLAGATDYAEIQGAGFTFADWLELQKRNEKTKVERESKCFSQFTL